MNWEAIGAVGEIVGALSVVLTLIYLARQVHEARQAAHAQIEASVQISWTNRVLELGDSRERADLVGRGLNDFDSLDQADKLIFHTRMDAFLVEFGRQLSHFEEKIWTWKNRDMIEGVMVMILTSPGGAQWWEEAKTLYSITDYLDNLVVENRNDLPPISDFSMFSILKSPTVT
jgi:hypothetical protein